ncbi:MAG: sodium:calcium symporter [Candidatus Dadabacteria bacterium]|nr:MAG: sodium:calcium symporter [Candidatus Dadabacteria bacterium]
MTSKKEEWQTKLGLIFAVAGSAVGLGNFLRFPGQAVQNGGGVFMIPYFVAFILLGIPICWAEWIMGKHGGQKGVHSCPAIYYSIGGRVWGYLGSIGVVIPFVIYMYYVVIESWCFGYALYYLFGLIDLGADKSLYVQKSKDFFSAFIGASKDGALFENGIAPSVICWLFVFSINFYLIYQGLTKGIEKFCKYAIPLMAFCALIILVRVLTLGTPNPDLPDRNVINGLGFMWNPKGLNSDEPWYVALSNPSVWLNAAGQIFFSLSVGFGIIITYASYVKKKGDVILSGLTAASTNEFFEVCFGGLITVTAAYVFLGASGAVGGTFGLGFQTLPVVFLYMPAGNFFGFVWFFMLFLAAITSSLSMLQPVTAFLKETIGVGQKASVALLGVISALGSLFVIYFSKDSAALDTMDFWVGTFLIFIMAASQAVLFSYVLGVEKGIKLGEDGALMKLPKPFGFVIKYISPFYLLAVFVGWAWLSLPTYIEKLSKGGVPLLTLIVIAAIIVSVLLLTEIGNKKWEKHITK